eukprot:scpid19027/ scgid5900/ Rho guanine nucleotide exchange factor 16; Ephexin-4
MSSHTSKPLPPPPSSSQAAPRNVLNRSELTSALAERRMLVSSDENSHQDRLPVSPQARAQVSSRRSSPKEQRYSVQVTNSPSLPNRSKRFSAVDLPVRPAPTVGRGKKPGPPPPTKPKLTSPPPNPKPSASPAPKPKPGRLPEQRTKLPTSPLQNDRKPTKSESPTHSEGPPKPIPKPPLKPRRSQGDMPVQQQQQQQTTWLPTPPTRSPPPQLETQPSEELYEAYAGGTMEDFYEAPMDDGLISNRMSSVDSPNSAGLYRPMDFSSAEAISFGGRNFDEPSLFDSAPSGTVSPPVVSARSERGPGHPRSRTERPPSPPRKPLPNSSVSTSALGERDSQVTVRPRPAIKTKAMKTIQAENRSSFGSFSEPNSPNTKRTSKCPSSSKLGSKGAAQHGSVGSLHNAAGSANTERTSRPSSRSDHHQQQQHSVLPAPPTKPLPKVSPKHDKCLSPPSVPRRVASSAVFGSHKRESGVQEDYPEPPVIHAVSPFKELNEKLSKFSRGQSGERSGTGTPDSAVGRSSTSPESSSDIYDDVIIDVPHRESDGPVRAPGWAREQPGDQEDEEAGELTYESVPAVQTAVRQVRPDHRKAVAKRVVDRLGPRISMFGAGAAGASAYQAPDQSSVSDETYTHLQDTWTDPAGSVTGSFYEMDDFEFDEETQSVYEAPQDDDGYFASKGRDSGQAPHVIDKCRMATMKASRGYILKAAKGLDPPGEPPAELASAHAASALRPEDLYSENGRELYPLFMKTGLNAVRFGKFPSFIQGRQRRPHLRRTDSKMSVSSQDKGSDLQYQYIQLIILHEEVYNNTLRTMVERFVRARDFSPDLPEELRVIDKPAVKALFSNIEALFDASTRLLSGLKSRQAEQGGDMESVSDLFQYMLCECMNKLYMTYCTNHVYQLRKLEELCKDNSHFSRSLAIVENDRSLSGNKLASFLSVPISYIIYLPKYLQVLTENLPPQATTVEFKTADSAKKVARWCDEAAQTVNRTEQLVRTEHQLDFAKVKHIALVSQARRLIRSAPVRHYDVSNPAAPHRQDAHLLVFNDLIMLAKPKGIMSTLKNLGSSKSQLKVQSWCERRQVHVETDEKEMLDFPVADQEKTLKGGLSRLRSNVRKEAALDTELAFKLMLDADGERKEYILEAFSFTDRERWLTAIDNEASKAGHAVESIYEDAELTHYEVTTEHIASETDELTLTLGNTVLARRKAQDGWCFGEDLLTGRVGWFQLIFCIAV